MVDPNVAYITDKAAAFVAIVIFLAIIGLIFNALKKK
jgi:hypothetical protein